MTYRCTQCNKFCSLSEDCKNCECPTKDDCDRKTFECVDCGETDAEEV